MRLYSPQHLDALPTIKQGHFDNLKLEYQPVPHEPAKYRYWLSRLTTADGETHAVHVEQLNLDGEWKDYHHYGDPDWRNDV